MRKLYFIFAMILLVGFLACEDETTKYIETDANPAIPQGVYSVTGDDLVTIYWYHVQDADLDYYKVWRSDDDYQYTRIGTTIDTFYVDDSVSNATTYYYAVSSVDLAGNESALSPETVFDTPRPDGVSILTNFKTDPSYAGFDFSTHSVVPYNSINADIYLEYDTVFKAPDTTTEVFFINVADIYTDIQDMGYTYDFDEINYVPDTLINDTAAGWSEVGWVEVIFGHTYIIWTADNHFAKIRVYQVIEPSLIAIEWAYQESVGNPELARPQHDEDDYLRRTLNMTIIK
jgi:hypothetical protein